MDRLKWFIRIVVYVPLAVTAIALVLMAVTDGQQAWNDVYGAGTYASVGALAQEMGIQDAMVSTWGRHHRHALGRLLGLHRPRVDLVRRQ